jgi:hypothetical protein
MDESPVPQNGRFWRAHQWPVLRAPRGSRRNLIEFTESGIPQTYGDVLKSFKAAIIQTCSDTLLNISVTVVRDEHERDVFIFRMKNRMGSTTAEFTAAPDESADAVGVRAYKQIPKLIHTTGA